MVTPRPPGITSPNPAWAATTMSTATALRPSSDGMTPDWTRLPAPAWATDFVAAANSGTAGGSAAVGNGRSIIASPPLAPRGPLTQCTHVRRASTQSVTGDDAQGST